MSLSLAGILSGCEDRRSHQAYCQAQVLGFRTNLFHPSAFCSGSYAWQLDPVGTGLLCPPQHRNTESGICIGRFLNTRRF